MQSTLTTSHASVHLGCYDHTCNHAIVHFSQIAHLITMGSRFQHTRLVLMVMAVQKIMVLRSIEVYVCHAHSYASMFMMVPNKHST